MVVLGLAAAFALLFALRSVGWRVFLAGQRLAYALARRLGIFVRAHPLKATAARRFPRLYAFVSARLGLDGFIGLPLTLIVAASLYLLSLLAGLTEELLEAEELIQFDEAVAQALDPLRSPLLTAAMQWLTDLGGSPAIVAVALTATAFLWIERRGRAIAALWTALVGSEGTTWAGKFIIGRERPVFLDIARAEFASFPSGHATASMATYGFLAYLAVRRLRSPRARFEVIYWTCVLVAIIAISRVYLGVHFLSDVASGLLVGGFWLLVGVAVAEWPRREPKPEE